MNRSLQPLEMAIQVYEALPPRDQVKLIDLIYKRSHSPCDLKGHSYRAVGHEVFWFGPSKTKLICSKCAKVVVV